MAFTMLSAVQTNSSVLSARIRLQMVSSAILVNILFILNELFKKKANFAILSVKGTAIPSNLLKVSRTL